MTTQQLLGWSLGLFPLACGHKPADSSAASGSPAAKIYTLNVAHVAPSAAIFTPRSPTLPSYLKWKTASEDLGGLLSGQRR